MKNKKILLVEDNADVQDYNRHLFTKQGFTVVIAMTLSEASVALEREKPDIIVLDIGMPDGSGLDFLREIKKKTEIPVLMLTGYDKDDDVLRGFDFGCDDYLKKPYIFGELLARLKTLLKSAQAVPDKISYGALKLDILSGKAFLYNKDLCLSQKEFAMLLLFTKNKDCFLSAGFIYEKIWGQLLASDTRALTSQIYRLRQKIAGSGYDIITKRGYGYCFRAE